MKHQPVLLNETIQFLDPQPNQNFIDCTLGDGGHAAEILEKIQPNGKLIGLDQNPKALKIAYQNLAPFHSNLILVQDNFRNLEQVYQKYDLPIHGILLDLGISSRQLSDPDFGLSYQEAAELNFRLDLDPSKPNAKKIVNEANAEELTKIFRQFGEEPKAYAIANAIVEAREKKPIQTTAELATIVKEVITTPPAQVFQALRIAVNEELDALAEVLPQALQIIVPEGRLAVISFHSLEDRIVKQFFKKESTDCLCSSEQPTCTCDHKASLEILTKKPVTPSPQEISHNPRSRSAKMRVIQKR